MACSNCYNGCTEIVSDKCVKYTGINVPILGIQTGDSLSYVEQALIEFLTSTLDGTGIKPVIDPEIICELVNQYLPTCQDLTATDLFKALIQAACELQVQIDALVAKFAELEQGYNTDCLSGSPDPTSTFDVLQATIAKLCQIESELDLLALNVDVNYVKLADLDALIQAYLDSAPSTGDQQYLKMVPYTVVEYYPPGNDLSNFDSTGKGYASLGWDKIYLCNGANGTPDKRGRSPIGSTDQQGPAFGNPTYNGTKVANGQNKVTLDVSQIPSHSHSATITISDPGHTHVAVTPIVVSRNEGSASSGNDLAHQSPQGNQYTKNYTTTVNTAPTGLSSDNVSATITSTGLGQGHDNVHPVLSCYYIMYIP
jgi:microcystin-dependent protein